MAKKKKPTTDLRLTGVVKAMNQAHERLSAGIPSNDVDGFRKWVRSVIHQIELACQARGTRPDRLPAPTYRAYLYLKSIDLNNLPVRHGPGPAAQEEARKPLYVNNLVAITNKLSVRLESLVLEGLAQREPVPGRELDSLFRAFQENALKIEAIFKETHSDAGDLPDPSRRAYQWLKFLSEPGNLELHMAAMSQVSLAGQQSTCRELMPRAQQGVRLYPNFFHQASLYRTRIEGDGIRLVASEVLISAPDSVLEALACISLVGKISPYIDTLNRYVDDEEFGEAFLTIDLIGMPGSVSTRGRYYDLEQSFQRVNQAYFAGKAPHPRLTWNRTVTVRKLGHYQPATDTVMISMSLDHPDIPEWVLDFVMYHELLHKTMGSRVSNGRRYSHTQAFRDAERRYLRYQEVENFLKSNRVS